MKEALIIAGAVACPTRLTASEFSGPDVGALAHLYRAEVYRSTMWRSRLDNTTNWAVASLGLSISAAFSSKEAPPFPLLVVGLFILVFLFLEARRYRYFNIWRTRARWMEAYFYAPMLRGEPVVPNEDWARNLSYDYDAPMHRLDFSTALYRRLQRNYLWIFAIQIVAYFGKLSLHPGVATSIATIVERASIGPISGPMVLTFGTIFYACLFGFAFIWPKLEAREPPHNDPLRALVDKLDADIV